MYIVNRENKHAVEAVRKISEHGKPGAFVMLSEQELDAFRVEVDVVAVPVPNNLCDYKEGLTG